MTTSPAYNVVACPSCGRRNRVPAAASGTPRCGNCHRSLPWITDACDNDFGAVAEHAGMPVLIDLWAEWCGPCRMVSPALEQLARDNAGRVKLVKVDVEHAPRTAQRYEARSIPMLVLLDHGRIVDRHVGAAPAPVLRAWLESALAGAGNAAR